jgi:hypothetical protein
MVYRWLFAGILFSASACHFDSSTANLDFGDDAEDSEPGSDPTAPDSPDRPTPAPTYFASGETTTEGALEQGSYEDIFVQDDTAEVIRAEVKSSLEKLSHTWTFENVPAGQYELTLVAHPYSPELEFFKVDYKAGSKDSTQVLVMPSGSTMTSFVARVDVATQTDVEIRAKLQDGATVVEEEPEPGIGFGWPGGFHNGNDPVAYRALGVDYIVLTQKNSITK